ncbi:hypothetical protein SAPIO_CDS10258 [Scedosporium apiospermum]|uniref:Heterokaryon incompatibility domain-containing protein n=1 Tax=Pseudallescheria apiosperma TaxID=563466 RepID=A0A084FV11_PSEDA|nr:uncharacterized protein SAPIO_CDS10258 [Scedosporium apiospermum]KEZ38923.1 hypothetical protein SAPIO_CDS10258 [Scedosporium apiospermum]
MPSPQQHPADRRSCRSPFPINEPFEPYRYEPLPSPRSIRLVILRPALTFQHPLRCSLRVVSLDEPPTYEALSYVWGSPQGTRPIRCNGREILVTPNCEDALRNLRIAHRPRALWIDAICIDQESMAEKSVQVPLMGDIYRLAKQAIVWLGPSVDGLSGTLMRLNLIGKIHFEMSTDPLSERKKRRANKILPRGEVDRICRICSNEWFQRIWTFQEFMLSSHVVFMLGRAQCRPRGLYTMYHYGRELMDHDTAQAFELKSYLLRYFHDEEFSAISSLLDLAILNRATDPRDKAYGFAAFLQQKISRVPPFDVDYSKSVAEVYTDFSWRFMCAVQSAGILSLVPTGQEAGGWPSWVPDLRDPALIKRDRCDWIDCSCERRLTGDEQKREFKTISFSEPATLSIGAKHCAIIDLIGPTMPRPEGRHNHDGVYTENSQSCPGLSSWISFVDSLDEKSAALSGLRFLLQLTPGLTRWDIVPEGRAVPEREKEGWGRWHKYQTSLDGCTIFSTATGQIGVCKGEVIPGDHIFLLATANHPFVLRRVGESFRVVGSISILGLGVHGWKSVRFTDSDGVKKINIV